jgi:hypothetical protein
MGIKLPKINIGRFLRKTVAPLIPGGSEVAEKINTAIKSVKGQKPQGPAQVVNASASALEQINKDEKSRQLMWIGLAAAGVLLIVLLTRRR